MKTTDIHAEIEQWMAGALCGGLTPAEQELFDRHIADCDACRALYREEQQMNTLLEKEMAPLRPEPEFGDTMVTRFREQVEKKPRGIDWTELLSHVAKLGRLAWSRPMQAVYAVLLLVAMVKTGSVITGERVPEPVNMRVASLHMFAMSGVVDQSERPALDTGVQRKLAIASPTEPDLAAKDAEATRGFYGVAAPMNNAGRALQAGTSLADADTAKASEAAVPGMEAAPAPAQQERDMALASTAAPAGGGGFGGAAAPASPPSEAPATSTEDATSPTPDDQRKLIRNATVQYEVADYVKAADILTGLITEEQGFLSTQNSDRGPNGKLEGTLEVKVPPERLNDFLLKLRTLGDLKGQTLSTEDVTKDYFDTDARVRNAQMEEQRLQDILNKNTGRLADILQVERELARVRQGIEQMQGTLRYYNTMVQYATVTITLSEKDLNAVAQYLLKQQDDLSIFAGDVEATFARARDVAAAAKAQVLDSNVERDSNGQTTATLSLLIDAAAADHAIAQLKALGRVQTFTAHTERVAQDGSGPSDTARTDKDKVEAHITVQQDQESPAQQSDVTVLAQNVEAKLDELKTKAPSLGAEVKAASFQRDASGTETGTVQLRMPLSAYPAVLAEVKTLGDVKNVSVNRQEGAEATDNAPAEMSVELYTQAPIVTPENGAWATIRLTLGEALDAVTWSIRMIGVSLAFFAPWLIALALVIIAVKVLRKLRRKSE
jgi:hypothetical protein